MRESTDTHGYIEPTPGEAANGWTAEVLTKYIRSRREAHANHAGIVSYPYQPWGQRKNPNRPTRTQSDYDPMRW